MNIGRYVIREQGCESVSEYRARVARLAAIYVAILLVAVAVITLLVYYGKLFITLSQRSNVETLTIAFILVLCAYFGLISLPGAWGAAKILWYNAPARLGRDRMAVERRKQRALTPHNDDPAAVFLNCLVRREGQADAPITIPLRDAAGNMGRIVIDGAEIRHEEAMQRGSNTLLAYFANRIERCARQRDPRAHVDIVQWATINDEEAHQYGSIVAFSRNLERQLRSGPLWPAVVLTEADVQTLAHDGAALCPVLRDEAQLPEIEYQVQHQLPIIPEPLGIVSLSRSESRADPVASMGCALIVAVFILALVVLFILMPPWVPGK